MTSVAVSHAENVAHDEIEAVLTEADGFGVPVYVTKR